MAFYHLILGRKKAGDLFQISCSVCRCVGGGYLVIKVRGKLTRCEVDKLGFLNLLKILTISLNFYAIDKTLLNPLLHHQIEMFFFTPSIAPSNAIKRFIHADESIAWIFNHAAFAPCFFKSLTEQIPTCLSCSSKTFPILGSCDNFSKFYTSVNSYLLSSSLYFTAYQKDSIFYETCRLGTACSARCPQMASPQKGSWRQPAQGKRSVPCLIWSRP